MPPPINQCSFHRCAARDATQNVIQNVTQKGKPPSSSSLPALPAAAFKIWVSLGRDATGDGCNILLILPKPLTVDGIMLPFSLLMGTYQTAITQDLHMVG